MKKTLIALAALAATGAFAQNVTLSGNLDQTYSSQGNSAAWTSNSNSTSLFNLAGTEDLGGGMKAKFDLTSELNLQKGQSGASSTGAGGATTGQTVDTFNRAANVSLESGMGTVAIGRQTDPWFAAQGSLNTSGSNSYGFATQNAVVSNGAAVSTVTGFGGTGSQMATDYAVNATNDANTGTAPFVFASGVSYATPVFSGFQAKIFSATTNYNNAGNRNGVAYSLAYANGPLKLTAATSSKNDSKGTSSAWTNTVYGGTYTMGAFTFIVGQNKTKFDGDYVSYHGMTSTGLGLNYVVNSKVDMNVSYGTLTDDVDSANKATLIGLTARYKLSNRTQLYAGAGNIKNEGASTMGSIYAGSYGNATVVNTTTGSFMLGLKHTF